MSRPPKVSTVRSDHVGDALVGGQVGLDGQDALVAAGQRPELRHRIEQARFAASADRDAAAFLTSATAHGQAEPAARAGHDCDLVASPRSMGHRVRRGPSGR